MFRKALLSLFAVLCFVFSYAAPTKASGEQRIGRIEEEVSGYRHVIDSLEYVQSCLSARLESTEELMGYQLTAISNVLAESNRFLEYFGIVLAIIAIGLGAYVTWMQNRVQKMSEDVDKKSKEIVEIQQSINSGFDEFYKKIRRADTVSYLKRLESVPMDIINILDIMFVRDLEAEDFDVLKRAFQKLVDLGKEHKAPCMGESPYGAKYYLLFFSFFLGRSIEDDFLRERLSSKFTWLVACCFEVDIKRAMSDVAPVLHQKGVAFDRVALLKDLLLALRKSEFKNNAEVFAILQNGIADEELWKAASDMVEKEENQE